MKNEIAVPCEAFIADLAVMGVLPCVGVLVIREAGTG